jgi:hypothetical protein
VDANLITLIAALVGPSGVAGAAYAIRQLRSTPPPSPDAPGDAVAQVQSGTETAVDALLDELVDLRADYRHLRRDVWGCPVEHCVVRDRLRQREDPT